jgi:TctA family transporter
MMEENLRRTLFLSQGDPSVFVTRPISLTLLLVTAAAFLYALMPARRRGQAPESNREPTEKT